MGKRLITKDYRKIVIDTHNMLECDFIKYFLGVIEDNYNYNPDIIRELRNVLSMFIRYCEKGQGLNSHCGYDECGEGVIQLGEKRVKKTYFKKQLKIVEQIGEAINVKNKHLEFEESLPKEVKDRLKEVPFTDRFDPQYLRKRVEFSGQVLSDLQEEKEKELKDVRELIDNSKKQSVLKGFKSTLKPLQIESLFSQLIGKYIDCSEGDFRAMFSDDIKPIKWLKSNALLAFFVSDIFQKDNPDNYWSIAESIFTDRAGDKVTSLRQSFNTAYNNKSGEPKNYSELKNIYTPL